jgi:hypothetical protein
MDARLSASARSAQAKTTPKAIRQIPSIAARRSWYESKQTYVPRLTMPKYTAVFRVRSMNTVYAWNVPSESRA